MSNTHEKITIYGIRLKHEAKKRGLTNDDMAQLLHYSSGKQISPIYSCTKELTDDRFTILSKAWNVRENYLRCIDDFETDDDLLKNAKIEDIDSFNKCKDYLETIGLRLCPFISSKLPICKLYSIWKDVQEYLSDSTIKLILSKYDFNLDEKTFNKKYYCDDVVVQWKKTIDKININFSEVGKESNNNQQYIFVSCEESNTKVNVEYEIGFHAYYNNALLCDISISGLQLFMKQLDSFARCSIDTLFKNCSNTLIHHIIDATY